MGQKEHLKLFEDKKVRVVWDDDRRGGHVAKAARTQLESQLGHSVVSSLNAKDYFASLEQGGQKQTEKGEDNI